MVEQGESTIGMGLIIDSEAGKWGLEEHAHLMGRNGALHPTASPRTFRPFVEIDCTLA
jgi:hypothetical protein